MLRTTAENASPFFAAFSNSWKTLEKMAQPSHPCLKPSLHNRQFFFVFSFLSTRVSRCLRADVSYFVVARATKEIADVCRQARCLALARAPNPV